MKIINFSLSKITAEKKKVEKGKISVKSKIDLSDIKEEQTPISEKKALNLSFSFEIDFEPKIGNITLEGNIIILTDGNEAEEVMKEWKKKQLPPAMKLPIFNFIMTKCNIKAIQIEGEIGLPTHIPMPKFSLEPPTTQEKVGKESKNPGYAG